MNYIYPQKEFFKNIPGIPNYLVSNYGRVKSKYKINNGWFDDHLVKCRLDYNYMKCQLHINGKRKKQLVHRLMLTAFPCHFIGQEGKQIDHIDVNPENNALSNLRKCTNTQNGRNNFKRTHCSSKYKGVHFHIVSKRWISRVTYKERRIHLGMFRSEVEAAKMYDDVAGKLFGEFAKLNFSHASCVRG